MLLFAFDWWLWLRFTFKSLFIAKIEEEGDDVDVIVDDDVEDDDNAADDDEQLWLDVAVDELIFARTLLELPVIFAGLEDELWATGEGRDIEAGDNRVETLLFSWL